MCGGFAVIKDVWKSDVFKLCKWRNLNKPVEFLGPKGIVVPERIITKPPSAELREDQKDNLVSLNSLLKAFPYINHLLRAYHLYHLTKT